MRFRLNLLTLLGVGLLALPALAQPPEKPADEPPAGDPAMKQKLLDDFDTNKDGTLDRAEARAIGRAMRENFDIGPGSGRTWPEGRPTARTVRRRVTDAAPRAGAVADRTTVPAIVDRVVRDVARRSRTRGSGSRAPVDPMVRRHRPPNPERLFNRFDENKDGSLSKDEFKQLTDFMREHRPMGPPMAWRGGPGRGFDGPPPRRLRASRRRRASTRLVAKARRARRRVPRVRRRRPIRRRRCPGRRDLGSYVRLSSLTKTESGWKA